MGGLYDILESYRDQQNRLNYEGLYKEPADTSINLDPMYNIGARQFGDMRMGMPQVQATGIMQQAPLMNRFQGVSDMSLIDETTNDEQDQNYIDQVNKKSSLKDSLSSMGKKFGLSSLLGLITGNPIFGLIGKGAEGLGSINDKMQNSMFGRSKTLSEYFDNRKIAAATGSKDFMDRPRSERNYTGPSGNDNTGGGPGSKGASDSFSNKSGMGRTGY